MTHKIRRLSLQAFFIAHALCQGLRLPINQTQAVLRRQTCVQKLLGHSNSKMTQRYAKLAPSTLADAVQVLAS